MTITFSQARDIAQKELLSIAGEDQFQHVETKEFDVGWVFYYQATSFVETSDLSEVLAGNAPMFVSRDKGHLAYVNYLRPLEESLAAYRACGDISACEIPEIRLLSGREGASIASAIQAIRQYSALGAKQAKDAINSCLSSHTPTVQLSSMAETKALILALASAGFDAEICYSVPRERRTPQYTTSLADIPIARA